MKKKIILFLSFLLTAMFLTGCSEKNTKTIEGTKIEKMTEIANKAANERGYKLPDGYKVSYPDETTNSRLKITDYSGSPECIVEAVFDVSEKQPKLLEISTSSILASLIVVVVLFFVIIGAIIGTIVRFICKTVKKIAEKTKEIRR